MMKFVVAIACLVALAFAAEPLSEEQNTFLFTKWMKQHSKSYERSSLVSRFETFKANLAQIRSHNTEYKAGVHTYFLKMNQFGDLANAEFATQFNGYNARKNDYMRSVNTKIVSTDGVPASVDWTTTKNVVTPVKNQGQCGSCWSFSTTGGIEGACTINGKGWGGAASKSSATGFYGLSEQQLVDCSTAEGNMGCNGGLMDDAFEYVVSHGGLTTAADYPYTATGPNACNSAANSNLLCPIKSYKNVQAGNVEQFKAFLSKGPVSIAIQANQFSFQFYGGGIMSGACGTQLDHGVLAVGYGTQSGKGFFKVKNSWGATWGESGFILLASDVSNGKSTFNNGAGQCGLLNSASSPCMDASCSRLN